MSSQAFHHRRQQFSGALESGSLAILFSGNPPVKSEDVLYSYAPDRNFYYLTGIDRPEMILVLWKQGDVVTETLFIEKADPTVEKWTGHRLRVEEARDISGMKQILFTEDFHQHLSRLLGRNTFHTLFLDLGRNQWADEPSAAGKFAADVQRKYPYLNLRNAHPELAKMRVIKSEEEVANIRKAIEITRLGIEQMWSNAAAGMMEYELQAHFDFVLRKHGVKEPGYESIIAGGHNATVLHYEENNQKVSDNEVVLLDLGAQWNYYSADISRSFPINGKFTDRQRQLYEIVLKAEVETIAAIKPGVTWAELNALAKRVLADGLKKIGLIDNDDALPDYYYHSVGHFLGLNVHDVGATDVPFQPGMVVTIEPGLYIAEEAIGIRIEDNVLVTADGGENLSHSIIKTVEDIESFMARGK